MPMTLSKNILFQERDRLLFEFGPGMLWKKSDNFKVNLSPATGKMTFVMDQVLADAGAFGVEPGENMRMELGFYAGAYHKADIMKMLRWKIL